jgi:hypothetical protein
VKRYQLDLAEQRAQLELDVLRQELTATMEHEMREASWRFFVVTSLLAAALSGVAIALMVVASR